MGDAGKGSISPCFHTPVEFVSPCLADLDVLVIVEAEDQPLSEVGALGPWQGERGLEDAGNAHGLSLLSFPIGNGGFIQGGGQSRVAHAMHPEMSFFAMTKHRGWLELV